MRTHQINGSGLKRPIIYSVITHVFVIILLVMLPGVRIPFDKQMKIDVQWVELPKGTSEDIDFGVQKSAQLPQSTIQEQKEAFQPEKVEQKTLKPELKAPPPAPPPPVAEKQPEKPKAEPKAKPSMAYQDAKSKAPRASRKTESAINRALASIDKDLKGRQVVPESGQVADSGKGYKYGTSDKPLRVSPSDPEYLRYQAQVRAKIMRSWIVPTVSSDMTGRRYTARIDVFVNGEGSVTSTRILKSSGNSSFDQSALRAVRAASPFPRPPERLSWEAINEGFSVAFNPDAKR